MPIRELRQGEPNGADPSDDRADIGNEGKQPGRQPDDQTEIQSRGR